MPNTDAAAPLPLANPPEPIPDAAARPPNADPNTDSVPPPPFAHAPEPKAKVRSASPTACPLRAHGRADTQNDRTAEAVVLSPGASTPAQQTRRRRCRDRGSLHHRRAPSRPDTALPASAAGSSAPPEPVAEPAAQAPNTDAPEPNTDSSPPPPTADAPRPRAAAASLPPDGDVPQRYIGSISASPMACPLRGHAHTRAMDMP